MDCFKYRPTSNLHGQAPGLGSGLAVSQGGVARYLLKQLLKSVQSSRKQDSQTGSASQVLASTKEASSERSFPLLIKQQVILIKSILKFQKQVTTV